MRILITSDPELPVPPKLYGGIERIINFLAIGLTERGHQIGLLAHPESTCPVEQFFAWPGSTSQSFHHTIKNTIALDAAIQQFKPDVLHSFSRIAYFLPQLRSSLHKVMSYQRQPSARTVKWASRLGGDRLQFTGCSEYICSLGRNHGGEWSAIPNGVEFAKYDFSPQVPEDAPLVFLSRIEYIKGAHLAIQTAIKSGKQLIIAGNHYQTGEAGEYWFKEIKPYIDGEQIRYIGPVDDDKKNKLLGQAAALIVPIQWDEPFGIVFVEALACGTPVISCPRGALPEIVRQGVDGFLIKSIEEGCKAVANIATIDRATCRTRVENHFSADVIVSQYKQLYTKLLHYH